MEDPDQLLRSILGWAQEDPRVDAVVQTGSRARGRRVDDFSDLDIELIGEHPDELARDASWIGALGEVMVTLPLDNDGPDDLGWPTRLVVLDRGRKIDFTLAGWQRIDTMVTHGLDDLYAHGYVVQLDKTGRLSRLPVSPFSPPRPQPPGQREFTFVESEYWFEATQVAMYLARSDLWVVKFRESTMHGCLLQMLEWYAHTVSGTFPWHIGHHMSEWLPTPEYALAQQVFSHFDVADTVRALDASFTLFEGASQAVASHVGLRARLDLPMRVRHHVGELTGRPDLGR